MKLLPWAGVACVLTLSLACNKTPAESPVTPTAVTGDDNAAADGSTLKVTAPSLVSPTNDARLTTRQPSMQITTATGKFANRSYTYEFQLMSDAGAVLASVILTPSAANVTWNYPTDLERDTPYRWRARARLSEAFGPWSAVGRFFTVRENRTPDPDPSSICFDDNGNSVRGCIPPPDGRAIISQVLAQNPGILDLKRSCQEDIFGGSHVTGWEFLDKVVDALYASDSRWGYNCKRGNCSDPSLDVITYHWGIGPTTVGNSQVYAWDIVGAHCAPGSFFLWNHITNFRGAGAAWTNRGRVLQR